MMSTDPARFDVAVREGDLDTMVDELRTLGGDQG